MLEIAAWLAVGVSGWTRHALPLTHRLNPLPSPDVLGLCATAGSSRSARNTAGQTVQETASTSSACAPSRWQKLLAIAFVAGLALAVVAAIANYCKSPLGDWDAWTIWNQRARFLLRGSEQWRQAFSPVFAHTDYPLLLPSSNARLWSYLGAEPSWARVVAGHAVHVCHRGTADGRDVPLAKPESRVAGGADAFGNGLVRGSRDLTVCRCPIGFLSAFCRSVAGPLRCRRTAAPRMLGAFRAGGGAGGLDEERRVGVARGPARRAGAVVWRRNDVRRAMAEVLVWTTGVVPPLAVVVIQKSCLAGGNEFITGQSWHALLARLSDPGATRRSPRRSFCTPCGSPGRLPSCCRCVFCCSAGRGIAPTTPGACRRLVPCSC